VDRLSPDVGAQVVRAYLSRQHYESVEDSCPMVALPSDVTRSNKTVKRTFEAVFQAMVRALENSMPHNGRQRHITAQATAAMCVGGMIVARAMAGRGLADQLRDDCMAVALHLGGWNKGVSRKSPKN